MHEIDVCRKAKQNDDRHTQTHTNGEFHTKRVVSPHETSWDTDTDGPAPKNDVLLDVYMRNTFLRQSPSTSINFDTRKNNGKQNDERHTYTHTNREFRTKRTISQQKTSWDTDKDVGLDWHRLLITHKQRRAFNPYGTRGQWAHRNG